MQVRELEKRCEWILSHTEKYTVELWSCKYVHVITKYVNMLNVIIKAKHADTFANVNLNLQSFNLNSFVIDTYRKKLLYLSYVKFMLTKQEEKISKGR